MSDIISAPYETSITAGLNAIQVALKFIDDISPAFITLIQTNLALHKEAKEQRIIDRRIREITRICRKKKLTSNLIIERVDLDFSDLNTSQKTEISDLLIYELINSIITKNK